MSDTFRIIKGAIEVDTNKFILPQFALSKVKYRCFDDTCNRVVFKINKSTIGATTHFRHAKKDEGEGVVCNRYSLNRVLTTDETHKEGILNLKYLLENNKISKRVIRYCSCCGDNKIIDKEVEELEEGERIVKEYPLNYDNRNLRADIARIGIDGKLKEIYEVKNTHSTKEEDRPCDIDWYEIDAKDINRQLEEMENYDDIEIELNCLRVNKLCDGCGKKKEQQRLQAIQEKERCIALEIAEQKKLQQQAKEREIINEQKRKDREIIEEQANKERLINQEKRKIEAEQERKRKEKDYTEEELLVFKKYDELQAKLKLNYDKINTPITEEERRIGRERTRLVCMNSNK